MKGQFHNDQPADSLVAELRLLAAVSVRMPAATAGSDMPLVLAEMIIDRLSRLEPEEAVLPAAILAGSTIPEIRGLALSTYEDLVKACKLALNERSSPAD